MVFFRSVTALSKLRSRLGQQSSLRDSVRWIQTQSSTDLELRSQLAELIPEQQERLKKLKTDYGKVQPGNITVDMVIGGMRGMTGLLWETPLLDPDEGIRFRGLSIPECQKVLPAAKPGGEPLPEGLLWLLLTGKVPSKEQVDALSKELRTRAVVPGPNRVFGDLIGASGITDEMLDTLIALKDFQGIKGLPPLSEIEDIRYEKNTRKSSRAEIERQKQEEVAKARVRTVDDKGRAYGTGRRKCSVARVWIQPGNGKFTINDKQFDAYFPMLDHRAALLRPFSETKTLGLWDIACTVQGGGTTGQVGAIQLGVSRALQNWEPDLRPALKESGFLTRDSRVVERKKPGKAKARKSFQWVKR